MVNNLTIILEDSNAEDQTTENLDIVSEVLQDVVGLLGNFSVDEEVKYLKKMVSFALVCTKCVSAVHKSVAYRGSINCIFT